MPKLAVGGVGDQPLNPEMFIAGPGSCRASAHAARRPLGTLPPPSLMETRRSHGHGLVVPCVHIPGIRPAHGCDVEDGELEELGEQGPEGQSLARSLLGTARPLKHFRLVSCIPCPRSAPTCRASRGWLRGLAPEPGPDQNHQIVRVFLRKWYSFGCNNVIASAGVVTGAWFAWKMAPFAALPWLLNCPSSP